MIKISMDTKQKELAKYVIQGSVEVRGDIDIVAHEIYTIMKDLEKSAPEALEMAIEFLIENID